MRARAHPRPGRGAIGVDAARYSLIRSSVDTAIDDLALWSSAIERKPVYYVQYAHATALSAGSQRRRTRPDPGYRAPQTATQQGRAAALGEFPRVLPDRGLLGTAPELPLPGEDLAGDYHRFYDSCRVLPQGDEQPTDLHTARLALCQATVRSSPTGWRSSASAERAMNELLAPGAECVAANTRGEVGVVCIAEFH